MPEERRLVTILFSDVAGSTALGEELDPEDLRALLGHYYAIAKEVVAEHGGTLEKFIGDAVMAVFGLPVAHGDDAVRAIAAAEQLRDRVRAEPKLGEHLPIRIGLNTGEVVATRDANSGDFLITGDAVNIAARLQQLAEPWAIVCGERTASAAAGQFAFGPAVELTAKGKREPLRALPLAGRAATRPRVRMPLFGRTGDLAQLDLAASRVLDDKRPFLVSVIAPAGTGKSRLLEEFLDRLETRAPDARVAIAQCLPYGQRLTYWPLRAVLYRLVGIGEEAPPAAVRDAIGEWLAANEVADAAPIPALLAATLGAREPDRLDPAPLLPAWPAAIEVAARDALPDTVQATGPARLDGLAEDQRRLIQIGAVFGRTFRAAGVEAIAPEFAGRAQAICEELIEKDLVRPTGADSNTFRHILIREVAYQTLPRATRTRLHAAAGAWIERSAAGREDAVAELIALHYREAAAVASASSARNADTVAIRRNAVRWLVRAAGIAQASAPNIEAARHLPAAIEPAEPAAPVDPSPPPGRPVPEPRQ